MEELNGAALTAAGIVMGVEEGALFREGQFRPVARSLNWIVASETETFRVSRRIS